MKPSFPSPKRFLGDAHAVVAMIFRPRQQNPLEIVHVPKVEKFEHLTSGPVQVLAETQCTLSEQVVDTPENENLWREEDFTSTDVFFILRASNKRDRWSGQVAFPGGRKKEGETDLQTAIRETHEEIGLDLSKEAFKYLGRLNDRVVVQNNKKLVVSCLLFKQIHQNTPKLSLDAREVAACGWVSLDHFKKSNCTSPFRVNLLTTYIGRKHKLSSTLIESLGVTNLIFTRILLPIEDVVEASSSFTTQESLIQKQFSLWGLTMGMVSEFLLERELRQEPFTLTSNFGNRIIPVVFDSAMHNITHFIVKEAIERVFQRKLSWEEGIVYYMSFLFGSSIVGTTAFAYFVRSKL